MSALERLVADAVERHFAELSFAEVRRALQALSRVYVNERERLQRGAVFDGAGKRAAFALFYAPIHFALISRVLEALEIENEAGNSIIDLGCGTGVGGAAWAVRSPGCRVRGYDLSAWAVSEANRVYKVLGVPGVAKRGDASRVKLDAERVIAAYTVNELDPDGRIALREAMIAARQRGTRTLIVEPIAKRIAPWWSGWSESLLEAGARVDEWRFDWRRPELVARFDKAARLDHRELTARTLWL